MERDNLSSLQWLGGRKDECHHRRDRHHEYLGYILPKTDVWERTHEWPTFNHVPIIGLGYHDSWLHNDSEMIWNSPMYAVNMSYYNLLIKKLLCPTAGQDKARWEN